MRHCFNLLALLVVALGCSLSSSPPVNTTDAVGEGAPEAAIVEVPAGSDGGPTCPMEGFTSCGGVCINTRTDVQNCGGCGTACGMGQVCAMGVCALNCGQLATCQVPVMGGMDAGMDGGDAGATTMTVCADTMNDPQRCGACDRACAAGEVCRAGACIAPMCPTGQGLCSVTVAVPGVDGGMPTSRTEARCLDLETNSDYCGTCKTRCLAGQRCRNRMCESFCPAMTLPCEMGQCVPIMIDPNNCGACRNICPAGNVCVNGTCQLNCGTLIRCTGSAIPDGGVPDAGPVSFDYCADTQVDPNNCGRCGTVCARHERCEGGLCRLRCQPPLFDCLGQCLDLRNDNRNCGACGRACATGLTCAPDAMGVSTCIAACMAPFSSCPAPAPGSFPYCANLNTDVNNCGMCGRACLGAQSCVDGVCRLQCLPGQQLCGSGATQVCTITSNDARNCGACGNVCPAGALCNAGRCEPRCLTPLIGCPATAPTFCVDARYDPANCGRCGRACDASLTCIGGSCCTNAATPDAAHRGCSMGGAGCASSFVLLNGQSAAQGFTTGSMGGFLVRARLHMSNPYSFVGRAAQVYVVPGTSNLSILLPSTNVEREAVATTTLLGGVLPDWYDAAFSPPVRLEAGRNYFIVLKLPSFPTADCPAPCVRRDAGAGACECPPVRWTLEDNMRPGADPYPAGFAFSCGEACPIFTQEAVGRDHAFEVYLSNMCVAP
jgi:hypothetical protein